MIADLYFCQVIKPVSYTHLKKPVTIWRYASTMLYFSGNEYYLTEFSSDWAKEAQMSTQPQLEIYADDVKCSHGATAVSYTHLDVYKRQPPYHFIVLSPDRNINHRS